MKTTPSATAPRRPVEVVIKIEKPTFTCLYFTFVDGKPFWTPHRREAKEFSGHSEEAQRIAAENRAHAVPCLPPPGQDAPAPHERRHWLPYHDPED